MSVTTAEFSSVRVYCPLKQAETTYLRAACEHAEDEVGKEVPAAPKADGLPARLLYTSVLCVFARACVFVCVCLCVCVCVSFHAQMIALDACVHISKH